MQAIIQTEQGNLAQAEAILDRMYRQTDDDYEKFLLAYQFAKVTTDIFERVKWLSVSLESAQKVDDEEVKSAYVTLFRDLSEAYIRRWVRQTVRDAFVITVGLVLFVFVVALLLAKLICSIC